MRRSALLVFAAVFLGTLALYISTAAPSLTWAHDSADGADLIAAVVTNGVPHPPGYPTYVTLGQLIARLPVGEVAYRFNLFSALCMALAAGFTASSILRQIAPSSALARFSREGVSIVASLFFAAAPMVWGQATVAEVHALNACCVALVVYLIAPIVFRGEYVSLARLTLAAGVWGAAMGNSITIAALLPLTIAAWRRGTRWRPAGQVNQLPYKLVLPIVAFLIGLGVYAAIPLRAGQQPPINWGDATSLDRFIALITAEMYRGYLSGGPASDFLARLIALAQLVVTQYGWLGVILGSLGIYYALLNPNKNWRLLAATMILYLFFAVTYSAADSALYLIPVWMFGAWAIARGLLAAAHYPLRFTPQRAASPGNPSLITGAVVLLIFLLGPALNVMIHYPAMNLRGDHTVVKFAGAVLSAAPPQAVVITENDGQTFALWYHRHVAGQRPDLAIVDRRLAGYPWYAAMLRAQGSAPLLPDDDPPETWIDRVGRLNPGRSLCVVDRISGQMSCRP